MSPYEWKSQQVRKEPRTQKKLIHKFIFRRREDRHKDAKRKAPIPRQESAGYSSARRRDKGLGKCVDE
jgi:hypothetical protein